MAPEQLAGARPTSAVDVWAWGVTMIFAATGRSAFGADTVPAVMHRIVYGEPDIAGVPASLIPAVKECLEKDPQRRPSARDLLLRLVDPSVQYPTAADPKPVARAYEGPPTAPFQPEPPRTDPLPSGRLDTEPQRVGPVYPAGPGYPGGSVYPADSVPAMAGSAFLRDGSTRPGGPARSRRGLMVAAGGGAVVIALIVAGVLLLTNRSPGSGGPATGSTSGNSSSAPATTQSTTGQPATTPATTAPATGGTIPPAFAGTWSGTAKMSAIGVPSVSLTNPISFTFVAGATTISETNQSCVNTLTLTGQTATVLTFSEPGTAQCVAGTVTFTRKAAGLAYRWTDNVEQNVALLHKT
jgi:serine/threonine protein kinase